MVIGEALDMEVISQIGLGTRKCKKILATLGGKVEESAEPEVISTPEILRVGQPDFSHSHLRQQAETCTKS